MKFANTSYDVPFTGEVANPNQPPAIPVTGPVTHGLITGAYPNQPPAIPVTGPVTFGPYGHGMKAHPGMAPMPVKANVVDEEAAMRLVNEMLDVTVPPYKAGAAYPNQPMEYDVALGVARAAPLTGSVVVSSALMLAIEEKLAEGRRDAKRLDALETLGKGRGGLLLHTGQDPECVFGVGLGLGLHACGETRTLREAIDRATS